MRWIWTVIVMLSMCFCGALTLACAPVDGGFHPHPDTDSTPDEDPVATQGPLTCKGLCVTEPPATYTGPSLFWLGPPSVVPACPLETPYQGIEGYLDDPMVPVFARECLITPSDLCADEGHTCSPLPPEDFHVCIHHEGTEPCPDNYYPQQSTLSAVGSSMTITLCCLDAGIL